MSRWAIICSVATAAALSALTVVALGPGAGANPSSAPKPVGELSVVVSSGSAPVTAPIMKFTLTKSGTSAAVAVDEATNTGVSAALAVNSATTLASATITLDKTPGGSTYDTYKLSNATAALSQLTTATGPIDQIALTSDSLQTSSAAPEGHVPAKPAGMITIGSATAPFTALTVALPTLAAGSSLPTPGPVTLIKPVDSAGVTSQLFTGFASAATIKIVVNGESGGSPMVTYSLSKVKETAYALSSSSGAPVDQATLQPSTETVSVMSAGAPPAIAAPDGTMTLTLADGSEVSAPIESASVAGRSASTMAPVVLDVVKLADGTGATSALLQEDTTGGGISAAKVVIYTAPGNTVPLITYTLQKVGAASTETTTGKGLTDGLQLQTLPSNFETTYGSG